ncbi:MAG: cytochrome c, partial [Sphingobacteriales bacterium]
MKYCLLFLSFIVMLSGCNNKATSYFTTSNLASSFISIEADKDYTLQTGKGAVIKIAKGSFNTNGNEKIQLELKEAYSMQDILLAGLSTESNGAPLQSGGMIYINAKVEGRQLELLKPIAVSLPASVYDEQMQLFKGEIKADSSINWINPQPLDTSPVAKNISLGKYLYRSNCASCHKIFSLYTAGPMAGTSDRIPNREWLYKFIHNPAKMIATDPYAHKLYQQYQPT